MEVQDKILEMESVRGRNHDLLLFREWLDTYLPEHRYLNKIQVGGTNGKGSTSKWLTTFLKNAGFTTGMFTSPHLVSHMERIQVDQENISLADWERIYDTWYNFFKEKQMTMFEMDLWMALVYFIEKKVNVAILEVGMGGRLDATTALDYQATLITNVGMDHKEYLGDTIEQIAFEKSGIFKPNAIALTTETNPVCQKVMEQVADYMDVMLGFVTMPAVQKTGAGYEFMYDGTTYCVQVPEYQLNNMILALEALMVLGYPLTKEGIERSLKEFTWLGRFTVLKEEPLVLIDGAHNVPGITALVKSLSSFDGHIYFSVLKEKEAAEMLSILKTLVCPITLVSIESERMFPLETLGLPIVSVDTVVEKIKTTEEKMLLCGSLYFVGEVFEKL